MVRTWKQGGRERRGDLYCLLPCRFVVLNQPQWDPGEASEWESERERGREGGTQTLHLAWWGCEYFFSCNPNVSCLYRLAFLSLFPKIFKTQYYLHHFLPNVIPTFLDIFFLPPFNDSFLWCPRKTCLFDFFPFLPSLLHFILPFVLSFSQVLSENRESNTKCWRH